MSCVTCCSASKRATRGICKQRGAAHRASARAHGRIKDVVNAISAGQDVDYLTHPKNDSALMAAAYFGRVEVVKVLLAAGADASIMDVHQADALHHAIVRPRWLGHNASGHAAATIARLLIASGCNMTS